jgi:D-alanyl-D-alanine carboxypeptidase (penicillin-binding protein 5/6)
MGCAAGSVVSENRPRLIRSAVGALALLLGLGNAATAQTAPSTAAPRAILVETETGRVLLEKNADQPTAPASLAKLMTVALAFEALKAGRLAPDDTLEVSGNAATAARGATMGLRAGEAVSIRDLLQGLVIHSANEAAIVLAEGLSGSVPAFVALMNRRAAEIGLSGSRFTNPNGLPDAGQRVTMRDMAALAAHLVREHPERYSLFGQRAFTFRGRTYRNRNPLLDADLGADGLKTGQTAQAGYALVASAARGGRRLVLALNGLPSEGARAEEARRLMAWGFEVPAR